jgi:hypothetical protein
MKSDERRANYMCDITYTNNSVRCLVEEFFLLILLWLFIIEDFLLLVTWYNICLYVKVVFESSI